MRYDIIIIVIIIAVIITVGTITIIIIIIIRGRKRESTVRCVTSGKGPSTTWLSTCRVSNPDPCKKGK